MGPFPCGSWNDRRIASYWLDHSLLPGEMYVADGGYRDGHRHACTPGIHDASFEAQKAKIRARHETVNGKFKTFGALKQCFRHSLDKHGIVMRAVVNIVQLEIEFESPLFPVDYDDRAYHL